MKGGFSGILRSLEDREARKLEQKVPSWGGVRVEVPQAVNFQQCSGETAARYKASLIAPGARVADLTGGLGVDSWAFSAVASAVWYNERDCVLLQAVQRNFAALGVSNVVFNSFDIAPDRADWQEALRAFRPDVIYIDPARRNAAGNKLFLLEECSPDVVTLMPTLLAIAPQVMVKVSPMADLTMLRRRLQGYLSEIHVVGVDSECKELLCLCRPNAIFQSLVLFENGFVFREAKAKPNTNDLLFVPSAALVKSGLGPGMCLRPYDEGLSHFGGFWEVVENLPFAASVIKELGRRYPQADVTARGVPVSSEGLRAKIRTKPGGPVHIFAWVLDGERRILICKKVSLPE